MRARATHRSICRREILNRLAGAGRIRSARIRKMGISQSDVRSIASALAECAPRKSEIRELVTEHPHWVDSSSMRVLAVNRFGATRRLTYQSNGLLRYGLPGDEQAAIWLLDCPGSDHDRPRPLSLPIRGMGQDFRFLNEVDRSCQRVQSLESTYQRASGAWERPKATCNAADCRLGILRVRGRGGH